jgi:hypothetical protein
MSCYDRYITINRTTPSRSGRYAEDLPGVDSSLWELLNKEEQTPDEFWEMIYKKAWDNLVSDLTHQLQNKFFVDSKLVSRETSKIKLDVNMSADLAGVTIEFKLPRYARLHIVSVDVFSDQAYTSPEGLISVYDTDETGDLLSETSQELSEGRNTIFIDQDYEVDKVFVAFDPGIYAFRESENKKYGSPYLYWNCNECAFDCGGYEGKVVQINGGGLNVRYNVVCSIEKFLCENINLFKEAFFFRIGLEIITERMIGNRLNRFMTMTLERQEELFNFYNKNFVDNLERSVRSQNMNEDPYCFSCKELVSKRSSTP